MTTMSGVTDSTISSSNQVDETRQVVMSQVIIYRYILPVLVFLGILTNGLCVLVLNRPRLRSHQVNRQFLLLAVVDMLVCIFYIPLIITINGCTFSFVAEAYYYVYFGSPTIIVSQSLAIFIILFLAMDRFLAVWRPWTYHRIQQWANFTKIRLSAMVMICLVPLLIYAPQGTVTPVSSDQENDTICDNGISMVVMDGLMHSRTDWQYGYLLEMIGLFLLRWLPCMVLCIFNFGLIVAVKDKRIRFPRNPSAANNASRLSTTLNSSTSIPTPTTPATVNVNVPTSTTEAAITNTPTSTTANTITTCPVSTIPTTITPTSTSATSISFLPISHNETNLTTASTSIAATTSATAAASTTTTTTSTTTAAPTTSTTTNNRVLTNRERELIITMIAMVSSFIILMLPTTVYMATITKWPLDRCCVFHPHILVFEVTVMLLIVEHIIHILFLFVLNSNFREELMIFLRLRHDIN